MQTLAPPAPDFGPRPVLPVRIPGPADERFGKAPQPLNPEAVAALGHTTLGSEGVAISAAPTPFVPRKHVPTNIDQPDQGEQPLIDLESMAGYRTSERPHSMASFVISPPDAAPKHVFRPAHRADKTTGPNQRRLVNTHRNPAGGLLARIGITGRRGNHRAVASTRPGNSRPPRHR